MSKIIMYRGEECPHCHVMMPIVDRLIKDGFDIEKKEVWHNEKNAEEMRSNKEIILRDCDNNLGVPCFLSLKTKRAMCGECSYEELKKWLIKNC
jgi:ribosomal protein S27AE